jgi:hypothetical protein
MNIAQALSAARQHLVEGGGFGQNGDIGRLYLKTADSLLKLGIKIDEEIENEVFNVEDKAFRFIDSLKAEIERQRVAEVAFEQTIGSTASDAKAVQPSGSEGNPLADASPVPAPDASPAPDATSADASVASGALDSASGPAIP